ncbi:MAG: sulfatase [Verrucomicrobia bacterium]|jgi:arylsulfatase A-like enzyme|nr:sulfatase [Verrucomicrobiota bacterium]
MKISFTVLLGLALFATAHGRLRGATAGDPRPNILFIYTDDQSFEALSVVQKELGQKGRFPWLKTPNMDRIAADGVRFRNAFVVNSLCSPSRAVNLTGRYNHLNGIASNFRAFPTNNVTCATLLRAAGYTTAYVGKWHMDGQRERPGFDHHATYVGHGRYADCPFIVDGKDMPTKGWVDDVATDYAIRFMQKQASAGKPWFMMLGFKTPHQPWEPPARTKDLYPGELARSVPNLNTPPPYAGANQKSKAGSPVPPKVPTNLDYFRCLTAVDDCVGRLLDALDTSHSASNTVVMFTSDNGFYLGAHATGDKRSAYEESIRVPFLVRYPALGAAARGRVVDEMVLNLDLAQSLLDFAGLPAPKDMQGQSWRPLLTGKPESWRQNWFYQYFAENQKGTRIPDITAVRTTDAKLIRYRGHQAWNELFDLKSDPYEMHNLYNDPAHASLKEKLQAEHDRLEKVLGYSVPDFVDRPPNWSQPGGLAGDLANP